MTGEIPMRQKLKIALCNVDERYRPGDCNPNWSRFDQYVDAVLDVLDNISVGAINEAHHEPTPRLVEWWHQVIRAIKDGK